MYETMGLVQLMNDNKYNGVQDKLDWQARIK